MRFVQAGLAAVHVKVDLCVCVGGGGGYPKVQARIKGDWPLNAPPFSACFAYDSPLAFTAPS